jgi:hypothetical protein
MHQKVVKSARKMRKFCKKKVQKCEKVPNAVQKWN